MILLEKCARSRTTAQVTSASCFRYANDETEDCMLLTHETAIRLGKRLTDVRKSGLVWWLRPDRKTTLATVECDRKADGLLSIVFQLGLVGKSVINVSGKLDSC